MILVSEQSTSMCLLTSKRLPDLDLQIISFEIGPRVIDICTRLLLLLTEILLHSPVIRNIQTFRCHPLIFTFIVIFILIIKSNLSLVKWMHINKWQRLKVFCFIVLRLHLRNAYKCAPACPWKSTNGALNFVLSLFNTFSSSLGLPCEIFYASVHVYTDILMYSWYLLC